MATLAERIARFAMEWDARRIPDAIAACAREPGTDREQECDGRR